VTFSHVIRHSRVDPRPVLVVPPRSLDTPMPAMFPTAAQFGAPGPLSTEEN
jgi:hypothetical protein